MVYEWDGKRDECYQLYITENKSLEEIVEFYRDQNFVPSKRAFQARFKEWGFPAKHRPANKDADLAARIQELWRSNTGNKQMLEILKAEGWDVKHRELTKLRKEQNLLLREPNKNAVHARKRQRSDAADELGEQNGQQNEDSEGTEHAQYEYQATHPVDLAPEIVAKRQARQARLMAESEERLKAGTRRRRTKVWSGLPPDPVAPPRYPTELTLEECKSELGLDKQRYQELRDVFEGICRTHNVVKKTLCGAETWKSIKDELISSMPHLQCIFWGPNAASLAQTQQPMALELICMDVTKKIRTVGNRVTISEAKNILNLTPQESRDIRNLFDTILKEDFFVSKLEVPREHWEGLKAKWVEQSPLLQEKLAANVPDPDNATIQKCLESIAADVQKRHRDQQTKNDPAHLTKSLDSARNPYVSPNKASITAPFPTQTNAIRSPTKRPLAPFPPNKPIGPPIATANNDHATGTFPYPSNPAAIVPSAGITTLASQALATASQPSFIDYSDLQGMQIDPTLLEAVALPPQGINRFETASARVSTTAPTATPIYFRLSPQSHHAILGYHPKVWLCTFNPPYTVATLTQLALSKTVPGIRTSVLKIEGVAPGGGGGGHEQAGTRWSIDEDDELEAYLEMVGGDRKGKATFVVEIA